MESKQHSGLNFMPFPVVVTVQLSAFDFTLKLALLTGAKDRD